MPPVKGFGGGGAWRLVRPRVELGEAEPVEPGGGGASPFLRSVAGELLFITVKAFP